MISRLLRSIRRRVRPPTRAARHGLFFGPFPVRMPAEWGSVTLHASYRAAHARLGALVESQRGWRPTIGVVEPLLPHVSLFEHSFCSEVLHQLAQLAVVHAEGVRYDFVAAVSLGEYAAAAAAGAMSPEDVMVLMMAALEGILPVNDGDLVLLPLGARLPSGLEDESPLVMQGLQSEVRAVRRAALATVRDGVPGARVLELGVMPHTLAVDVTPLCAALAPLAARAAAIPLYTSSAGGLVSRRLDAAYWTRMVRELARLDELLRTLALLGRSELVGIGSITLESELASAGVTSEKPAPSLSALLEARPKSAGVPMARIDVDALDVRRDSHPAYERCRHAELVMVGEGELLAIGHRAVQDVLRRSADFSSAPNTTYPILHGADGPEHLRRRRALAPYFTQARQLARAPSMRARTASVVAALTHRESFALVADFARPIPFGVTCEWLGLDEARAPSLLVLPPTSVTWSDVTPALGAPGMLQELRNSGELPDDEVAQLAPFLLTAGLTTVTDFVVNAVCALHERPEILAQVRLDASMMAHVVSELLRLEPPVHALPRLAVRDTEIGGQPVAAGTTVQCGFAAANRDPAVHALPNALLPRGDGVRSLTFGFGPHSCLGAIAGHLLSEIMLGALLHDLSAFEPAEDVRTLLDRATPRFHIRRRVDEMELRRVKRS